MDERITATRIREEFRMLANPDIAAHSARFFKSGKGEYGEGDRFLGIRVPVTRQQARLFRNAPLRAVLSLLKSAYHEERLLSVLLLADQYARGDDKNKGRIFESYLEHREYINNWDIVDSSAHLIVGPHLESRDRSQLCDLAKSTSVWDRRIAMMSTYHFIRNHDFQDALKVAAVLIDDEHDLIHKVVGWMLREVGNRDGEAERRFLHKHYKCMPRTMLRYAIEKFPEKERKAWLHGEV